MSNARRWYNFFLRGKDDDTTVGGILLRMGFITRDQLREAITAKATASGDALLGEVLIAQGAVTRAQLERVLLMQKEARGEKVDYTSETLKLVAQASARAESLHGPLDELEDAARRYSVTGTHSLVPPSADDSSKH